MDIEQKFVSSLDNRRIKEAVALKDGKSSRFLCEGFHLVEMALRHADVQCVFSLKPYPCKCENILVTSKVMAKLSDMMTPEGVVAIVHKKKSGPCTSDKVLLLDEVRDPGNVGTLLRTALAFGYKDAVLPRGNASAYSARVISASQGAIFALNLIEGASSFQRSAELKEQGYTLLSTDLRGEPLAPTYQKPTRFVLILGNEAHGVSPKVLGLSDERIYIPISTIESLNVAVAGGILMHCL